MRPEPPDVGVELSVFFLLDPLETTYGPLRPPLLLARELKKSLMVCLVSPSVSRKVDNFLRSEGLTVVNLGRHFMLSGSLLTLEAWLRKGHWTPKMEGSLVVNFSQHFLADSDIYYGQGPITRAIDDMRSSMRGLYRAVYRISRLFLKSYDASFVRKLRRRSRLFIANSLFCAKMYEEWGVGVDKVIYPPIDCELFRPVAADPSGEYVLTYAGKETEYPVIKAIADAGVLIKLFGSKGFYMPNYVKKHPNIEFLGEISDQQLIKLYSNALYTLFTFTHEPFGYIPVESMACETPVLTYNKQGPRESVIHERTGWLVDSKEALIELAVKLWKDGYPKEMRSMARERALIFDVRNAVKKWEEVIEELL